MGKINMLRENEKISVIITVYNKEDYIVRCIQSVLNQSYPHIELIIIDDGSTDGSKALIKSNLIHNTVEIKTMFFDENKGLAKARNTGLSMATGKYIFFLDADDYLLSEALSMVLLINRINQSPIIALRVQGSHKIKPVEDLNVRTFKWKRNKRSKIYSRKSVASILFSRAFLNENKISFNENFQHFADLDFLLRLVNHAEIIVYVNLPMYIKGECIDPIKNPSMSLMNPSYSFDEYMRFFMGREVYKFDSNHEVEQDKQLVENNLYIERLFLRYYFQKYAPLVYENEKPFIENFDEMQSCLESVSYSLIENSGKLSTQILKAHLKGNVKKTLTWIKRRKNLIEWKNSIKSKQSFYKQLSNRVFSKLPIKNKQIVFESFGGKSYSCSPRAIYEELQRVDPSYTCVWAFNDPSSKEIVGNGKKVKRLSLQYYYYMATSKYWVINARVPKYIKKRDETEYVQTWHGTPLKRLAADMKEVHMPGTSTSTYKKNFYEEAQRWDYLVSPNDYSTEIFKRAFHFDKEVLDVGYPRNDLFYKEEINNPTSIAKLKERIGLPADKKVVLYAPTWRDDEFYGKGEYKFDIKLDLFDMKERLGDEYVVVLRMHYLIADNLNVDGLEGFAYNFSDYDDIAELYLVSDILITDYSSVFFDYANLNRPILFYTYDLDKYRNDLRGFYIDFEKEAPGPVLMTSDEVIQTIEDIDNVYTQYQELVSRFNEKFCHLDDGYASKNIIDRVIKNKEGSL